MCFSGFSNSHRDCGVAVAIFVTVAFGLSDPLGVSKMSAVAGIVRVGVAILVTVIPFGPSDPLGVSKVSRVTGIVGVGVTILVTIIASGLSDPLGTLILTAIAGVGFAILVTVNALRPSDPALELERIAIPDTVADLTLWESKHSGGLRGSCPPPSCYESLVLLV